jgi:long-chain fatty acid transport protein
MIKKIFFVLALAPAITFAGGFQLNVQGIKAIGMGGAFTGIGSDVSSIFFNPGAITNLDGHQFGFGFNLVDPHVSLQTNEAANINQTSGVGTPFMFYYSGTIFKEKFDNKLKVGFSVNNQYGSSSSFEDDWQGRNIIQNISLKTFMFQPTVAYKIHDKLSIGAGFVFAAGTFSTEKAVPLASLNALEGKARLEGTGNGLGFNFGVFSQFLTLGDESGVHTKFSAGVDYRSSIKVTLADADAFFTNIPTALTGTFPESTKFDTEIVLPSNLTVGLSAKHIKENWSLEFAYDLQYVGWSSYDSLNFDFENAQTPDSKTFQDWDDVIIHRFGVDFTYKEKYSVRAGAYYDEDPMKNDRVSPHLPGGDHFAYTFGLGYQLNDLVNFDFAVIRKDNEREASLVDSNFSAKYRTIANIYSIGANIKIGQSAKKETVNVVSQ